MDLKIWLKTMSPYFQAIYAHAKDVKYWRMECLGYGHSHIVFIQDF